LGIKPTPSISMHCDCQATIVIAKNKYFNGKNWHIRFRHDIVKKLLKDEIISIDYVKSEINLANPLTKPLSKKMILETSREMRLMLKWEIKMMVTQYVNKDPMNLVYRGNYKVICNSVAL
jgi:hypothetical protein